MNIIVKLIGTNSTVDTLSICLPDADQSVGDVKKIIASNLDLDDSSAVQLLFCGQFLQNDQQRITDLELGPSTFLNALLADVGDAKESIKKELGNTLDENEGEFKEARQWKPGFFVYCKDCGDLKPGKLRVRCAACHSPSVVLKQEPNSWNDVLTRGLISCTCLDTECSRSADSKRIAEFYVKCAGCSNEDGVVPLTQMKRFGQTRGSKVCSICYEEPLDDPMVVFSCQTAHATCLDCFISYAIDKLERRGFVMHPNFGYTLQCPEPRCRDGFIVDAHHFRLLGVKELYEKYHRLAAEIYLLGEGGVYCPKADCSEAFITDPLYAQGTSEGAQRKLIMCPKCGFTFCYYCRAGASECHCDKINGDQLRRPGDISTPQAQPSVSDSDELKSYVTIHCTTKSCPNCRAPTEKNEGCNHMVCGQCSFDWCWDCEKGWTEECQWNHWFE